MSFVPEPEVILSNALKDPYNTVVAAARTCYSSKVVTPGDVDKDDKSRELRDRIYDSIYQAGHHTTIQHPTFQFVLRRVSRQFLWSFLHAHPYYNSEQVSQRYVEVKPQNFATPPMSDASRAIFQAAVREMMDAYFTLMELLKADVEREYFALYPARKRDPAKWESSIHKRIMEAARYVLPVATHAHLYHTISGLTLHRYHRLSRQFDTPAEARLVVEKMVDEVRRLDPLFFRAIEDPVPLEETPEYRLLARKPRAADAAFAREFDADLGPRRSKLVDWKANAPAVLAQSVRSVLGRSRDSLADRDAIGLVLDPAKNPVLSESLVLTEMSKLSRAMHHPHYTFRKKLSHTADSQDQRHRMVPGTRPVLAAQVGSDRPDYVLPTVVESNPAAMDRVRELFTRVWESIGRIAEREGGLEAAHYLLPNAVPVRFEESGDLLNLHHKWTTRLCYLAQEEIWRCCREEVEQVERVHPEFAGFLRAPCKLRKDAGKAPYCPEGPRFCGVRVWELPLEKYERAI